MFEAAVASTKGDAGAGVESDDGGAGVELAPHAPSIADSTAVMVGTAAFD